MSGIGHVLSIAKEALLAHQLSVQVASHNIANVDTPGFTRQTLQLTPNQATPISAGSLGGGVRGTEILRNYDRFMTQRLVSQQSILGNLQAQQDSMRVVETVFNEAPGLALNDLMSQFWNSWQDLADNPELLAARQTVVQSGQLLVDQLQTMNAETIRVKQDIGVNLDTAIKDVNSLTSQIATLNVQITTEEKPGQQANDLRDQRDNLVKELGDLLNISYFENSQGAYTIMMSDGHTLVETNEAWQVQWSNNTLYWINTTGDGKQVRQSIGNGAELGGKIGGWLEVRGNLIEGDPDNYLGRLDALANSLIRELNQQHSQGVGMTRFDNIITSSETAANTARLNTPVEAATAPQTIPAGTITINGHEIGEIKGASTTTTGGLAMTKTANAVTAINDAITGVTAKLTTLVAGNAVDPTGLVNGDPFSFTINGVAVNYTFTTPGPPDDTNPATLAANVADAINTAITTYNNTPSFVAGPKPPISIEAIVGDGFNGGEPDSIMLRNTNPGDESRIAIAGIDTANEAKLGLTNDEYVADATHNTGEITLFSDAPFTVTGGVNDFYLDQLGMAGGAQTTEFTGGNVNNTSTNPLTSITFNLKGQAITVNVAPNQTAAQIVGAVQAGINTAFLPAASPVTVSLASGKIHFENSTSGDNSPIVVDSFTTAVGDGTIFGFDNFTAVAGGITDDTSNDGQFTFTYNMGPTGANLQGFKYADELNLDGTTFDLWLYNADSTLALSQPVKVSLERAYTLQDVADAINYSVKDAAGSPWVEATVVDNKLKLTPDGAHSFAFGNDETNFLQVAGLNTFFTGHSAGTIGINTTLAKDLNRITAGTINANGEFFQGDNSNVLLINNIQKKEDVRFTGGKTNTLDGFYNALVGEVGNEGRTIERSLEFNTLVTNQMNELRDSTSGVSLDEEMANLIKYQHAYTAASRLISMSDEMLLTLLNSV